MTDTFVIVGAGLAGAKAAETLRQEGFDGHIVLIGAEHDRPYERPPLSKDYLRGDAEREKVYVHTRGFYAAQTSSCAPAARAVELDADQRDLVLDDGERCATTGCCSTTGAEPRRLEGPRQPSSRACTTCAASTTPTPCASGSSAPPGSS